MHLCLEFFGEGARPPSVLFLDTEKRPVPLPEKEQKVDANVFPLDRSETSALLKNLKSVWIPVGNPDLFQVPDESISLALVKRMNGSRMPYESRRSSRATSLEISALVI